MTGALLVFIGAILLGALLHCIVPPCEECRNLTREREHPSLPKWVQHGLPLIWRVNARRIANDLIAVQPMTASLGLDFYRDAMIARARLSFASKGEAVLSAWVREAERSVIESVSDDLPREIVAAVVLRLPYSDMNVVVGPHRLARGSWAIVRHADGRREVVSR